MNNFPQYYYGNWPELARTGENGHHIAKYKGDRFLKGLFTIHYRPQPLNQIVMRFVHLSILVSTFFAVRQVYLLYTNWLPANLTFVSTLAYTSCKCQESTPRDQSATKMCCSDEDPENDGYIVYSSSEQKVCRDWIRPLSKEILWLIFRTA